MFFSLMGAAAGATLGAGAGVSPPTSATIYPYGEDLVGLQWSNGESGATTQIGGPTANNSTEPTSVADTVGVGVTSYETGGTDGCVWWVRHAKSGEFSSWVRVVALGCDP